MRDDLRNMGASLIAAGLVWYIKGPNAGLIVAGLGIAIVLFLHFFGKKKDDPQLAASSQTQENKQEFSPVLISVHASLSETILPPLPRLCRHSLAP